MRRFEIRSTTGLRLRFVTTEISGDAFIVVGERAAEVNVEGIIDCLCREVPEFHYGASRILWVTRAEDSISGARMVRDLYPPDGPGASSFEWGKPYSRERQTEDLQNAVIACEALLRAPD